MKILVVSQYFWPENFRINDLCSALVEKGHEVTVLTAQPNYPEGAIFKEFKNQPTKFDAFEGCEIVRVPIIARGKNNSLKLALNYLSYALSASIFGLFKLRNKQFDVIFVCQLSPVTVALPAILYKKIYKKKIVMWVLDLWPDSLVSVNATKSSKVIKLVGKLVNYIYKNSDLILGQSRLFIDKIANCCDDKAKIHYFPSWSESLFSNDQDSIKKVDDIESAKGSFKILFAGNIGEAQDFSSTVKAFESLKAQHVDAKLFVVGSGRSEAWLTEEIKKLKLDKHIYLLGRHPLEEMPNYYHSVDALLVTLKKDPAFAMTIPGKVQSYMASGKPILGMLDGEGNKVINESMGGIACGSGESETLAKNIMTLMSLSKQELDMMAERSSKYADNNFNRETLVTKLESWLHQNT